MDNEEKPVGFYFSAYVNPDYAHFKSPRDMQLKEEARRWIEQEFRENFPKQVRGLGLDLVVEELPPEPSGNSSGISRVEFVIRMMTDEQLTGLDDFSDEQEKGLDDFLNQYCTNLPQRVIFSAGRYPDDTIPYGFYPSAADGLADVARENARRNPFGHPEAAIPN